MLFDNMLEELERIMLRHEDALHLKERLDLFYVNRDLRGRVVLVWDRDALKALDGKEKAALDALCAEVVATFGAHTRREVIIESEAPFANEQCGAVAHRREGRVPFTVVDRVLFDSSWDRRGEEDHVSARTLVFFSVAGGVGRTTALAAVALHLAEQGKKVAAVDMNPWSPGLSHLLLTDDRHPEYGLVDWMVEDIVENGDAVLGGLCAPSPLADGCAGDILVVPAHGRRPGDYINKLSRMLMYRMDGSWQTDDYRRVSWPMRLRAFFRRFEGWYLPDCFLVDAAAGLGESSSACVLDLAPLRTLLFVRDDERTWNNCSILFDYWRTLGRARGNAGSLKLVEAFEPPVADTAARSSRLRERAWECFNAHLYDPLPTDGRRGDGTFRFERDDGDAPHSPWSVRWLEGLGPACGQRALKDALEGERLHASFPLARRVEALLRDEADRMPRTRIHESAWEQFREFIPRRNAKS